MSEAPPDGAEYRYLLWRTAVERHRMAPWLLPDEQRVEIEAQASRGCRLIRRALARPEAMAAPTPDPATVANVLESLGLNADTRDETLRRCSLDEVRLREVVEKELRAGWVIDWLMATASVDEPEVREYYEQHATQQQTPELRAARHILVTISEDLIENRRESAHARLAHIAEQWPAVDFATLAMRVSECPSALDGGFLGHLRRGQLYPALEAELFQLAAGEMSGIVESPLGFHLLHCDSITPPRDIGFEEAAPVIRRRLQAKAKRDVLRALMEGQ